MAYANPSCNVADFFGEVYAGNYSVCATIIFKRKMFVIAMPKKLFAFKIYASLIENVGNLNQCRNKIPKVPIGNFVNP